MKLKRPLGIILLFLFITPLGLAYNKVRPRTVAETIIGETKYSKDTIRAVKIPRRYIYSLFMDDQNNFRFEHRKNNTLRSCATYPTDSWIVNDVNIAKAPRGNVIYLDEPPVYTFNGEWRYFDPMDLQ